MQILHTAAFSRIWTEDFCDPIPVFPSFCRLGAQDCVNMTVELLTKIILHVLCCLIVIKNHISCKVYKWECCILWIAQACPMPTKSAEMWPQINAKSKSQIMFFLRSLIPNGLKKMSMNYSENRLMTQCKYSNAQNLSFSYFVCITMVEGAAQTSLTQQPL